MRTGIGTLPSRKPLILTLPARSDAACWTAWWTSALGTSTVMRTRLSVSSSTRLDIVQSFNQRLPCLGGGPSSSVSAMPHAFGSLDELGEGYGFRKIRAPLGVTAFGVNAVVYPPHYEGFLHYHDTQDELYFVHSGRARVEVDGETRELGPGGLVHVESTTPRRVSNASEDEELVILVVGGADGYVGRDGQMVDPKDIERRRSFSR